MTGFRFLKNTMGIDFFFELENPAEFFDFLKTGKNEKKFERCIYNRNFHPRAAEEIMEKIFAPTERQKLKNLMKELEEAEAPLIESADSAVKEIMDMYRNKVKNIEEVKEDTLDDYMVNVVCWIFEKIPPEALNLLGLIKTKPDCFLESYDSFRVMLEALKNDGRHYDQNDVKKIFSKALKELEELVKNVKNKKKPTEPQNGQSKPKPNHSKENNNIPIDSSEKPETQNSSENNESDNGTNDTTSPDLTNLQTLKNQVISDITAALNQTPPLTNSDLSSEHHDWENKINNLSDEDRINSLKGEMILYIRHQRREKVKKQQTAGEVGEIINSNLQKAQDPNATIQEKKAALADNEKYEGRSAYEKSNIKEQTENLKKEVARDNPTEYRNKIISDLDTKLKISKKINQKGAAKKITTFRKKIKKTLKSDNKNEINELKKQLTDFIKSDNVYYRAKRKEAQQLLRKLESGLINKSYSSESLPFSAQIGIGTGAVLVVLFFTLLIYKKKQTIFFQKHFTKNQIN